MQGGGAVSGGKKSVQIVGHFSNSLAVEIVKYPFSTRNVNFFRF